MRVMANTAWFTCDHVRRWRKVHIQVSHVRPGQVAPEDESVAA